MGCNESLSMSSSSSAEAERLPAERLRRDILPPLDPWEEAFQAKLNRKRNIIRKLRDDQNPTGIVKDPRGAMKRPRFDQLNNRLLIRKAIEYSKSRSLVENVNPSAAAAAVTTGIGGHISVLKRLENLNLSSSTGVNTMNEDVE